MEDKGGQVVDRCGKNHGGFEVAVVEVVMGEGKGDGSGLVKRVNTRL